MFDWFKVNHLSDDNWIGGQIRAQNKFGRTVGEMLVKIFSTATLIVLAWLAVQMLQTKQSTDASLVRFQQALADMRVELDSVSSQTDSTSTDIFERMDQFSAEQKTFKKSTNTVDPNVLKAKNQAIVRMQETAELQNAYSIVLKADLAAHEKQGGEAAKLLTSTKTAIWKTSDKWEKNKEALRELMAPIDILAGKWNRGDYTGNTQSIQKVLRKVLESQSQSWSVFV